MTTIGSFPIYIPQGWASIYGLGTPVGITGITPGENYWVFGTIYGLGDCNTGAQVGDSVLFNTKDVKVTLALGSAVYTMIETVRLAVTEQPLS